jgi:hypothetical protein
VLVLVTVALMLRFDVLGSIKDSPKTAFLLLEIAGVFVGGYAVLRCRPLSNTQKRTEPPFASQPPEPSPHLTVANPSAQCATVQFDSFLSSSPSPLVDNGRRKLPPTIIYTTRALSIDIPRRAVSSAMQYELPFSHGRAPRWRYCCHQRS